MDKKYWDKYYSKHLKDPGLNKPSSFAEFCTKNFIFKRKKIVEIGSGNGRDAHYFFRHGFDVIGLDQSKVDENKNHKHFSDNGNKLIFKNCDFVKYDYKKHESINYVYSRFTLHAISKKDELILLPKIYDGIIKNGLFLIEARTISDPLFGKGNKIEKNAFFTDHFRRFIDPNEFIDQILDIGFKIKYFNERNGLSIYNDDDPVLMRIILQK